MKEHLKSILIGLSVFPMGVVFYLIYVHVISFLDPFLSLVIGGGFILALLVIIVSFFLNLKDFVVSIFKKDSGVDDKGFKKF
jgi:uncharacterized membrane protein (DUF485 family)